ncbi:MAG: T9SS type A sorting domain-containing protein [Thermoanaerobaculia bacterium]|nr:T9SS type A sorting domain-containing protein [Thermoanaerobaculia bacterium]
MFTFSPNPAGEVFQLRWAGAPFTHVLLFDISGRLIREEAVSAGDMEMEFRVDHLPDGLYLLRCEGVGVFSTTRVVVAR